MEDNGFVMTEFLVEIYGNKGKIIDRIGDSMIVAYDPKTKMIEGENIYGNSEDCRH